uniref:Si:dkey-22o22.2 n=1 Tax=Erpetoichthys calabaricus TaxID=27687 RepID=A0A8C4TFE2_ERPCA
MDRCTITKHVHILSTAAMCQKIKQHHILCCFVFSGANAKIWYHITSGNVNETFGVEPDTGIIYITHCLNYEQEQRYELKLVASDGKWEDQTLVIVNVINRNDEVPVFNQNEYHGSVEEELNVLPVFVLQVRINLFSNYVNIIYCLFNPVYKLCKYILQVSAIDPDWEADQSALRYSLHGQGANSEFTIEEMTGRIYAEKKLDREKHSVWHFLVLATDENGEGLTGFADVIVEVQDVNDNPPRFLCATNGCFIGCVPENSPADTSIMEMIATDVDARETGKNSVLIYKIIQNVHNDVNLNLFSIHPSTGTIYNVRKTLDREQNDKYFVIVEAMDGGGLTGTGTATILVSDINDHAPIFTQTFYISSIPETLDINSKVLVISATDLDMGENALMTFSIVAGDDDHRFFIETDKANKCAVIRLKTKVDFEKPQDRHFNMTVKVEDMNFFSLAYCVIHVEDSNDNTPDFFPQFYDSGTLPENVSIGTVVTQVTAVDLDFGSNGQFLYSLAPESDPFDQFLVNNEGWILVGDALDHEKCSHHRLMVYATDMGHPPLTGSAVVLLTVQDINDNGPEFEMSYQPVVWENDAAPQFLSESQENQSGFNLTDLRNGSAYITALHTFDREEKKIYYLPILITDSGHPPMSSTNTLTIIIGDRNDHPHKAGHTEFIVYTYEGKNKYYNEIMIFFLLIAVTVWHQKGTTRRFRKNVVYHIPTENESWENIRENVLNYNEEGGGEQDQVRKQYLNEFLLEPQKLTCPIFRQTICFYPVEYSIIFFIWEADNDTETYPMDTLHIFCLEGLASSVGTLSSLESELGENSFNYIYINECGVRFDKLRDLYQQNQFSLTQLEQLEM